MEKSPEQASRSSLGSETSAGPSAVQTEDQEDGNRAKQAEGAAFSQTGHEVNDPRTYENTGSRTLVHAYRKSLILDETEDYGASGKVDPRTLHHRASRQADNVEYEQDGKISSQADRRTSEQIAHRLSSQADPKTYYDQIDPRLSGLIDRNIYEQTGHRLSGQADKNFYEQTDSRLSSQADYKTYDQADRRLSGQVDRKNYEQTGPRLSTVPEHRISQQIDQRWSISNDRRPSELTGQRLSISTERRTSEQIGHRLSGATDPRTSVQYYRASESVKYDDAYSEFDHVKHEVDYQADHFMHKEDGPADDYLKKDRPSGQYDYRIVSLFRDNQENEEAYDRLQSGKMEGHPKDFQAKVSVAVETDTGSTDILQNSNPFESKLTHLFQATGPQFPQILPSVSSKLNYKLSQESKPDGISRFEQGHRLPDRKSAFKRAFSSVEDDDPYQLALKYVEKHNILQIFQITENLVYEKPEDPLNFMLREVQKMMKKRDEMRN